MDSFSSKHTMNFQFEVTEEPCYPLDSKALADIEGKLSISVDEQNIFDEEDILLAEFSSVLSRWLNDLQTKKDKIFLYESMDYEDSPILKVEFLNGKVAITSVWFAEDIKAPVLVDSKQFINAAKFFVSQFEQTVPGISRFY